MRKLKDLFGNIDMTWKRVFLISVAIGMYTGIVKQIPFLENTSFRDISVTLEWWILFGMIIICNCHNPRESSAKTFTFFLVSQIIVCLIETPFLGYFPIHYFKYWLLITFISIPVSFIGIYAKKDNLFGTVVLSSICILLGCTGINFYLECRSSFPNHFISLIVCIVQVVFLISFVGVNKIQKIIASLITIFGMLMYVEFFILRFDPSIYEHHIDSYGNWNCKVDKTMVVSVRNRKEFVRLTSIYPGTTTMTCEEKSGRTRQYYITSSFNGSIKLEELK